MAYREIADADGRTWRVWNTDPHRFAGRNIIAAAYAGGWLTFETDDEKRRLAPVPEEWEVLDAASLLRLLEEAEVVAARAPR